MNRLQELLELIPKGTWVATDRRITDPKGREFSFDCDEVRTALPVEAKLYTEFLVELANRVPDLLGRIADQKSRLVAMNKELSHYHGRAVEFYNEGITDGLNVIQASIPSTPSSAEALSRVAEKIHNLLKQKFTHPLQEGASV